MKAGASVEEGMFVRCGGDQGVDSPSRQVLLVRVPQAVILSLQQRSVQPPAVCFVEVSGWGMRWLHGATIGRGCAMNVSQPAQGTLVHGCIAWRAMRPGMAPPEVGTSTQRAPATLLAATGSYMAPPHPAGGPCDIEPSPACPPRTATSRRAHSRCLWRRRQ